MELKMLEDWLSSLEIEGGIYEISMPKETCQHDFQLEEVGMGPAKELTGFSLLEGVVEK
jgi:hypothetical protein